MNTKNKKILIAEDSGPLLNDLTTVFSDEGFEVLSATNGEQALLIALENHPDLILLDIMMPKKDGITMLQELRGDAWGKNVPVIMLTNLYDTEKIKEAKALGVKDYLVKSDIRLQEILKKVEAVLK